MYHYFATKNLLVACIFAALSLTSTQALASKVTFESFETNNLLLNPAAITDDTKYLWAQYPYGDFIGPDEIGVVDYSTEASYAGDKSAKVTVQTGAAYFQFYPYTESHWKFAKEIIEENIGATTWVNDRYNRMEFFVRVPPELNLAAGGNYNMAVGTYIRRSNGDNTSAESGGGHYYHRYDIPYTGYWHKVVVDTHPTHSRGANGGQEQGNKEYPTGESDFNYFDLMTRFYVDFEAGSVSSTPAIWYFDSFSVYEETATENEDQVYSLNGVFYMDGEKGKLHVGWNRNKEENDLKHEVRYSFRDIHVLGWANAQTFADGLVSPGGWGGYNAMLYDNDNVTVPSGYDTIYIAIKPEGASLFKQIALPIQRTGSISSSKIKKMNKPLVYVPAK